VCVAFKRPHRRVQDVGEVISKISEDNESSTTAGLSRFIGESRRFRRALPHRTGRPQTAEPSWHAHLNRTRARREISPASDVGVH